MCVDKIEEEVAELRRAVLTAKGRERAEEEMGDLLFSIANLARKLGIEPESALRKANEKFSARFEALERAFEARGESMHDATLEEMEAEWRHRESQATAAATLHGPTANAKNRRSEEPKKKTRAPAWASRSGAGRRPATEVTRATKNKRALILRCLFSWHTSPRPRFARPDRRSTIAACRVSATAR